jgi:hypothetical protein
VLAIFSLVMLAGGLSFHALLEAKGGRAIGMAILLVGVVPVMVGVVTSITDDRLLPLAAWIFGISPVSLPAYASASLLTISELRLGRAVPQAFYFWLVVSVLVCAWLIGRLRLARQAIAQSTDKSVQEASVDPAAP